MAIKPYILRLTGVHIIFLSLSLTACGVKLSDKSMTGDIDVQLPMPVQRSDAGDTTQQPYEFQIVKLLNVFELTKVRGQYARFYLSPKIKDNRLDGAFPNADFVKNKKNVYTPTNEISTQMASIYFHMQNMALLDEKLGAGSVNRWPRDIGLNVKMKSAEGLIHNNAVYDGSYDAILFVADQNNNLPISVNGGILAHEHFHSLFYKMVLKKLYQEDVIPKKVPLSGSSEGVQPSEEQSRQVYNLVLLKGLNEGLADFWGWMYTNDNNFIVHSIPIVEEGRSLKLSKPELQTLLLPTKQEIFEDTQVYIRNGSLLEANMNRLSYEIGTQFARNLKAFVVQHQEGRKINLLEAKENIAKAVIKFLPQVTNEFLSKGKKEYVYPSTLISRMVEGITSLTMGECESFIQVLVRTKEADHLLKCKTENGKIKIQ